MENLNIQGSFKLPTLNFDYDKGELEISGRSLPENTIDVYQPALEWLDSYNKNPKPKTTVNVRLEYFNTSSSKIIIDIFHRLEKLHESGNEIKVNWYYEADDPDIRDDGEAFQEIIKVPIELIPVDDFGFKFT